MFKLISSVGNNLSERKYIKACGNLNIKTVDNSEDTNNLSTSIDENKILKELEHLEVEMRHENLRVFLSNIIPCRLKQFFMYTVPALLVAGGITLFVLPSTRVKTETLPVYSKESVTFVDDSQIEITDDNKYYGVYFDRTFSEPQGKGNTYPLAQTEIEYYLTENLEGFRIKAKIDSEGELSISEANKGEFVDLNEYDENTLSPIEPKYVELFDKVVEMVTESTYFNAKDDERLKAMSDSDKSHLVGTLVMQSYEGNENVDTIKSNWWARIAILVVLGLYDWLIIYLKNEQYVFESRILSDRNGELIASGSTSDISLINLGLKYKEAFMDAEERRIKRIHKLLEENFEEGTVDKILTNYEKRLVLK